MENIMKTEGSIRMDYSAMLRKASSLEDLAEQLQNEDLGDELLLSSCTLRAEGDLFLCGMTPAELEEKLNLPIRFVDSDGAALVQAVLGTEV